MGERRKKLLDTKTRELPLTAVAASALVLASVTMWQLGLEFERAWLRSYDMPLLGESGAGKRHGSLQAAHIDQVSPTSLQPRRWVANHDSRPMARTPHRMRSRD